ncbi:helix-turn-helix domain-containing protein [Nonomuraea sp. NPDC050404]|uniref:helix-turn-helix domain-containing protein n=1 Tax=Nonomuraea sp. NPDC050404 TaxID=3155783 RepID=UPI0033C4AFA1
MSDTWTIGELAEHAARALRAGASTPASGRVREVPGERLIRWYTTIGLVDPPLTRRGRVARYGRRHLLQLVAVKRLQTAGRSIAEIQAALTGATDRTLESAAGLDDSVRADAAAATVTVSDGLQAADGLRAVDRLQPVDGLQTADGLQAVDGPEEARDSSPVRGRFWTERPGSGTAHAHAAAAEDGRPPESGLADTAEDNRHPPMPAPVIAGVPTAVGAGVDESVGAGLNDSQSPAFGAVVAGVRLGDGVRLVLDAGRVLSGEDVQAVLAAAGPLLAVLEERELL